MAFVVLAVLQANRSVLRANSGTEGNLSACFQIAGDFNDGRRRRLADIDGVLLKKLREVELREGSFVLAVPNLPFFGVLERQDQLVATPTRGIRSSAFVIIEHGHDLARGFVGKDLRVGVGELVEVAAER